MRIEPLDAIDNADVAREGFGADGSRLTREQFVAHFCAAMRCEPTAYVRRIEFRYHDDLPLARARGRTPRSWYGCQAHG